MHLITLIVLIFLVWLVSSMWSHDRDAAADLREIRIRCVTSATAGGMADPAAQVPSNLTLASPLKLALTTSVSGLRKALAYVS